MAGRWLPGRSTMDQIFALQQVFEKSWKYAKEVSTCFVDFEKTYDYVARDKLWAVLLEYDVIGQLLATIKSLYKQSEVCVCVNGMRTKPFNVSVGLQQGCVLSPSSSVYYIRGVSCLETSRRLETCFSKSRSRLGLVTPKSRSRTMCLESRLRHCSDVGKAPRYCIYVIIFSKNRLFVCILVIRVS